jgi:hypothetical protein
MFEPDMDVQRARSGEQEMLRPLLDSGPGVVDDGLSQVGGGGIVHAGVVAQGHVDRQLRVRGDGGQERKHRDVPPEREASTGCPGRFQPADRIGRLSMGTRTTGPVGSAWDAGQEQSSQVGQCDDVGLDHLQTGSLEGRDGFGRHVQPERDGLTTACLDGVGNRSHHQLVDVGSDDSRTLRCQTPGYRRANPGGGPGDKGDLTGQVWVAHHGARPPKSTNGQRRPPRPISRLGRFPFSCTARGERWSMVGRV